MHIELDIHITWLLMRLVGMLQVYEILLMRLVGMPQAYEIVLMRLIGMHQAHEIPFGS